MRAILDIVSPAATLVEALEPIRSDPDRAAILLDIDGTLAPIVRHAADAHVPEATRTLLIEIAKRYGVVGCVSGRRAGDRAPDRRDRHARLRRQPRRRAAAPGLDAPRGRPRARRVDRARARVRRARPHERAPAPARAQRGQGRDRRVPLARRARTRRPPRRPCGRSPSSRRRRASSCTGAARCSRCARRSRSTRAWASPRCCAAAPANAALYVGDDTTDLDAFRGLRELVAVGPLSSALCVAVDSDEAPPELAREADLTVDGTAGVRELLEALL